MLLFLFGGHERDDVVDGGLIGLAHAEIVVGPDLLQEDEAPGRRRLQGEEPRVDLSALVGPPERLFFWSNTNAAAAVASFYVVRLVDTEVVGDMEVVGRIQYVRQGGVGAGEDRVEVHPHEPLVHEVRPAQPRHFVPPSRPPRALWYGAADDHGAVVQRAVPRLVVDGHRVDVCPMPSSAPRTPRSPQISAERNGRKQAAGTRDK